MIITGLGDDLDIERGLTHADNCHIWACRRDKGALLIEEVPKLEKLVRKGKKITQEIIDDRSAKVSPHPFAVTPVSHQEPTKKFR